MMKEEMNLEMNRKKKRPRIHEDWTKRNNKEGKEREVKCKCWFEWGSVRQRNVGLV